MRLHFPLRLVLLHLRLVTWGATLPSAPKDRNGAVGSWKPWCALPQATDWPPVPPHLAVLRAQVQDSTWRGKACPVPVLPSPGQTPKEKLAAQAEPGLGWAQRTLHVCEGPL